VCGSANIVKMPPDRCASPTHRRGGGGRQSTAALPQPLPQAGEKKRWSRLAALKPLWACWRALYKARETRGPARSRPARAPRRARREGPHPEVAPRERLDAHKLIEDYMIAANVAAAKALEAKKAPVMYRDP
jgi:ribonuclease R